MKHEQILAGFLAIITASAVIVVGMLSEPKPMDSELEDQYACMEINYTPSCEHGAYLEVVFYSKNGKILDMDYDTEFVFFDENGWKDCMEKCHFFWDCWEGDFADWNVTYETGWETIPIVCDYFAQKDYILPDSWWEETWVCEDENCTQQIWRRIKKGEWAE